MVMRRCDFKTFTPFSLTLIREQRNVLPSGASIQTPLCSLRVEEFGVATGGGVWVAAGAMQVDPVFHPVNPVHLVQLCRAKEHDRINRMNMMDVKSTKRIEQEIAEIAELNRISPLPLLPPVQFRTQEVLNKRKRIPYVRSASELWSKTGILRNPFR
jgi:hypothetical protein